MYGTSDYTVDYLMSLAPADARPDTRHGHGPLIGALGAGVAVAVTAVITTVLLLSGGTHARAKAPATDQAAESTARNAISVFETCQADNGTYPAAAGPDGSLTGCPGQLVDVAAGTQLAYFKGTGGYLLAVSNIADHSGATFCYSSTRGGGVTRIAAAPGAYRPAC